MKWLVVLVLGVAALVVLSLLLIGCSETKKEPTAPEPMVENPREKVEQFGLDLYLVGEEDLPADNIEPQIIIPKPDDWRLWLILKDRMEHCEDYGLGIDLPEGFDSWEPQPDSGGGE